MKLTELAEYIVEVLNNNLSEWKPTNQVVSARATLDWVGEIRQEGLKVLIVPQLNQYQVSGSRKVVRQFVKTPFITLLVGYTFPANQNTQDVASWEDVKTIIDTREAAEELILTHDFSPQGVAVQDPESEPVDELELGVRNFNAVTSFPFEDIRCGTSQESSSLQISSSQSTNSPETKASIRRQVLSGQKLGRH